MANVNGREFSFPSVTVRVNGEELFDFKGIKYSEKISRGKLYSNQRKPRARTRGKSEFEGSITFYKSGFAELIARLGPGWADEELTIVVQHAEGDDIVTDTLLRVLLNGGDGSAEEGEDPLEVECELDIMDIEWGGIPSTIEGE